MTPNATAGNDASQLTELLYGIMNTSSRLITYCEMVIGPDTAQPVDLRYRLANQALFDLFGLPQEAVIGKTITEVNSPFQQTGIFTRLLEAAGKRQAASFEIFTTKRWFLTNVTPVLQGVIISFSDITHHKYTEQQNEQALQLLQRVLDASPYSIVYCSSEKDTDGQIIDFEYQMANKRVEDVIGIPPEDIVGVKMTTLFPGIRENPLFSLYVAVVETQQPQSLEWLLQLGSFNNWYLITAVPFGDGFVATIVDITRMKKLQIQLENTIKELKTSNEYLQHFAYIASHDLQEPLRKIQAFSGLMLTEYSHLVGDDGADILYRMKGAAQRMQNLIRDLLVYSRISTQPQSFERVPLHNVIDTVLDDLEIKIQEQDASVVVEALPVIEGDPVQLQQLFLNLVSNALKFVRPDQKPEIVISCHQIAADDLPLLLQSSQQAYYVISVQDNGIGFNQDYQERIFQLFHRLHNQNTYPGTGIGLAICKKAAENHGGTITARSAPGKGATFSVFLPKNIAND
ncbi:sensor histidine kinase [Arsenicibacter rosenii]|uniref:histidine kinase n=1 Tax=Arsenicibacter rosenii TaxID=1750698 RepID=A0A1S2VL39_9BACT|nr:ATP-binding protein [Arsenicibacter rosenii]OIN59473.1 hypothetical protein BLX24_10920 [Arsenicibacter rosenii]